MHVTQWSLLKRRCQVSRLPPRYFLHIKEQNADVPLRAGHLGIGIDTLGGWGIEGRNAGKSLKGFLLFSDGMTRWVGLDPSKS